MRGYKYRANLESDGYRDIESLLKNEFYAPTFSELNDPFEGSYDDLIGDTVQEIKKLTLGFRTEEIDRQWRDFQDYKNTLGIYSLELNSKNIDSPINELLWAHYANGHRGFCIDYDIDKLISSYETHYEINKTGVVYQSICPKLKIEDLSNSEFVYQKMFGTKSAAWIYENEIRLIFDTSGIKSYHPSALKSVYFGLNMDVQRQNEIIKGLENNDVRFYKMEKINRTYHLKATLISENKRHIKDRLSSLDYKIMKTTHNPTVENFHVLLLSPIREKSYLEHFVKKFREEYATKQSNILLYDDEKIYDLIGKYPLYGKDEKLFADHLIAMSTFDVPDYIWMYPDK